MRIALFCIMAGRTKHMYAQRSFRFLAERFQTLANGTSAKRLVGETSGHQTNPTLSTTFLPRATPFLREEFSAKMATNPTARSWVSEDGSYWG